MNKITSVFNKNTDVFQFESIGKNQIKHHISWDENFIKNLKELNQQIRLEVIPTANGPYFATENQQSPYPFEIISQNKSLIGYRLDSNTSTSSSTALSESELTDLNHLLFSSNYDFEKESTLKKLLLEKIKDGHSSDRIHIILSSKNCIVGIRVFIESSEIELILPTLRKTIQTQL